ncbi:hypothetical protein Bca101_041774 [Brassica carinata]
MILTIYKKVHIIFLDPLHPSASSARDSQGRNEREGWEGVAWLEDEEGCTPAKQRRVGAVASPITNGSLVDWKYSAEQFVKKFPEKVFVHRSESNSSTFTFDGVDMMGERLANEVFSVVKN